MKKDKLLLIILYLSVCITGLFAKADFAYSYIPKQVFDTQVFPVTIVSHSNDSNITTMEFDPASTVQPIDSSPVVDRNGDNIFYTFYFKANTHVITIPNLIIENNNHIHLLDSKKIPVQTLNTQGHNEFCGLIATSCKLLTAQASEFDAQNNIVSITFKTSEANPNEIHIKQSMESGIEKISKSGSSLLVEYYFVVPASQKSIDISYYNTVENRFISKRISTQYKDKPVAAQVSLNPIDSSFDKIKKYGLMLLALFFLFIFWQRKEMLFLILFSISVIILFTTYITHGKVCVQEGAPLYILPTPISTASIRIDKKLTTDILNKRDQYYKIEYNKNTIGWIKNEDTCQN